MPFSADRDFYDQIVTCIRDTKSVPMTITNLVFITRKPSLSFDEFVAYFEEVHVPLTYKVMGDTMPKEYRRHYTDSSLPALVGSNRGIDLVLEMVFEDREALDRFLSRVGEGDNMKVLQDSWPNYCDEKGETIVTAARTFGY